MRKMMKVGVVVVGMVMGMFFAPTEVKAETVKVASVAYETEADGTAYVSSIDGTAQNVKVSATVVYGADTYTVTSVGAEAFALTDVTSVTLPDTVKKIGTKAFYGCKNLAKLNVPAGLETVEAFAFGGTCSFVPVFPESVVVAENVTDTEEEVGTDTPLEDNGDNVTSDSGKTDTDDKSEETATQPADKPAQTPAPQATTPAQTPTTADTSASSATVTVKAEQVTNKKVTLNGVTYQLNADMTATLTSCKKATKVTIPAVIKLDGKNYKVTKIADKAFCDNNRLTSVKFGKNVKEIGKKAFYKCTKLKKVTLPKSVTKVGSKAFYGCKKLSKVTMKAKSASIGTSAFKKCSKKIKISAKFLK